MLVGVVLKDWVEIRYHHLWCPAAFGTQASFRVNSPGLRVTSAGVTLPLPAFATLTAAPTPLSLQCLPPGVLAPPFPVAKSRALIHLPFPGFTQKY